MAVDYARDALKRELIRDEGKRLTPYRDTMGNWTVGVGHLLVGNELMGYVDVPLSRPRKDMTEAECEAALTADIGHAERNLSRLVSRWRDLDPVRQRALLNLSFNLGGRLAHFVGLIRCVEDRDWAQAAEHLKNSRWWRQVKSRGPRIARAIETGQADED